jgi:hypothetical protein
VDGIISDFTVDPDIIHDDDTKCESVSGLASGSDKTTSEESNDYDQYDPDCFIDKDEEYK